jgi:pimeloyl-CoA synthetase
MVFSIPESFKGARERREPAKENAVRTKKIHWKDKSSLKRNRRGEEEELKGKKITNPLSILMPRR